MAKINFSDLVTPEQLNDNDSDIVVQMSNSSGGIHCIVFTHELVKNIPATVKELTRLINQDMRTINEFKDQKFSIEVWARNPEYLTQEAVDLYKQGLVDGLANSNQFFRTNIDKASSKNYTQEEIKVITQKIAEDRKPIHLSDLKKICEEIADEIGKENYNANQKIIASILPNFLFESGETEACQNIVESVGEHYYPVPAIDFSAQ